MLHLLWVGLGGLLGSVARYGVGRGVEAALPGGALPWATLLVNVAGCLAIGMLAGAWGGADEPGGSGARVFWMAGVLGGFTTFSALGLEVARFLEAGAPGRAALMLALNVGLGVPAACAGLWLTRPA